MDCRLIFEEFEGPSEVIKAENQVKLNKCNHTHDIQYPVILYTLEGIPKPGHRQVSYDHFYEISIEKYQLQAELYALLSPVPI